MTQNPKYDNDMVNLGYLNKRLGQTEESINNNNNSILQLPKNYSTPPNPPYYKDSLLCYDNKIYRCNTTKLKGEFSWNDWTIVATDDTTISDFIKNTYELEKLEIQEQIDGKVQTYYQENDPAKEWATDLDKGRHVGDYWYNTTNDTQWRYNQITTGPTIKYGWGQVNIPKSVFDTIDTKKSIYTEKPTSYKKDDLWIIEDNLSDEDLPIGTDENPISKGDWVFSVADSETYDKTHWVKRDEDVPLSYLKQHYYTITEIDSNLEIIERNTESKITKATEEISLNVSQTYTTKEEHTSAINDFDEQIGTINQTITEQKETLSDLSVEVGEVSISVESVEKTTEEIIVDVNGVKERIIPTATATGSNIYVDDASDDPLIQLEIEGKSKQENRSGIQKFREKGLATEHSNTDFWAVNAATLDAFVTPLEDGWAKFKAANTGTSDQIYNFIMNRKAFDIEPDTEYTMILEFRNLVNINTNGYFNPIADGVSVSYFTSVRTLKISTLTEGMHKYTLTSKSDLSRSIINSYMYLPVGESCEFECRMSMLKGNYTLIDYTYEEYGISPSPNYPSQIKSVGYENLLDFENIEIGWATINDKMLETLNSIDVGTYTISLNFIVNSILTETTTNIFGFIFMHPLGNLNCRKTINNKLSIGEIYTINYQIIITPEIKGKFTQVYLYGAGNDDIGKTATTKTQNCILTKGTHQHNYIPYGKYGIEVETVGKNILQNDLTPQTKNGITVTINEDKSITFNGTSSAYTEFILSDNLDITLKNGIKYILSTHKEGTISGGNSYFNIISSDKTELYVYNNNTSVNSMTPSGDINIIKSNIIFGANCVLTNFTIYPMLEENQDMTEYQPYQERTSVIELNAPLRNLPNGIKDIAYIKNNKLYVDRYVGSVVLNGSENWIRTYVESSSSYAFWCTYDNLGINAGKFSDKLCNYFKYQNEVWTSSTPNHLAENGASSSSVSILFNVDSTIATTVDEFKTWLSTHNTQVDYELAEPYTEELGKIEMLKTLKGYNNISTTDKLLPIINLTYVRDTIIADYVENHVTELKLTENEIKASVENVSSSVDGLNTTINRVEEITTDNSQVINIISSNIDKTTGEVREVTTTTGFTFNADGMTIDDGSGFKAEHTANGTYYKDGNSIVGQYTKDGSKQKDLELFGIYSYGKESIDDTPMFIGQLYRDENNEQCFGHFYNGGD